MKKITIIIAVLWCVCATCSHTTASAHIYSGRCPFSDSDGMRAPETTTGQPISIIFDTDIGNDVDDALAMDMLYKYADNGNFKILGILTNKDTKYAPEFVDIMNTWYGYPRIPIGKISNGVTIDDYVNYAEKVCHLEDVYGKPMFRRTLKSYSRLLPSHELYRKLLASQPDSSVVIISVGFFTNLARLLESEADRYSGLNGIQLIAKKVKYISLMAGDFVENPRAEFNVVNDIPAAQKVFAECPSDIVVSPFEVGKAIRFPATVILNDCNFGMPHPMVQAYLNYRPMPYDRQTWDLTSVLYVTHPEMFTISGCGTITVTGDGHTAFSEGSAGRHRILSVTKEQADNIKAYFIKLITSRPISLRDR